MYIQTYNYNVNMTGKKPPNWLNKIKQKVLNTIPEKTFKEPKDTKKKNKYERWEDFSNTISRPSINRLIVGFVGLFTQPFIDYHNRRVDEDTREVSRNRTIAKILVGTSVGFTVRELVYVLVEKMTNENGKTKFSKLLLPTKECIEKLIKNPNGKGFNIKTYRAALSTIIALLAMVYTNFKIDAPQTMKLTNTLNKRTQMKKVSNIQTGGVE